MSTPTPITQRPRCHQAADGFVPEYYPEDTMLAVSKAMSVKEEKYRPEDADGEDVHMTDVEMMPPPPPQTGECRPAAGGRGAQARPRRAPLWSRHTAGGASSRFLDSPARQGEARPGLQGTVRPVFIFIWVFGVVHRSSPWLPALKVRVLPQSSPHFG